MMKSILFLMIFLGVGIVDAQENKIVKLLNKALIKDIVLKSNHFNDKITIIEPYKIQNGVLSVTLEFKDENNHYIEKNEVEINTINFIAKDINVLFLTNEKSVVTSHKNLKSQQIDDKKNKNFSSQFFTGIRTEINNGKLAHRLQKAFKRAGVSIKIEYWYD